MERPAIARCYTNMKMNAVGDEVGNMAEANLETVQAQFCL